MSLIQQDDTDVVARELAPLIVTLAKSVIEEFCASEQTAMQNIFSLVDGWQG